MHNKVIKKIIKESDESETELLNSSRDTLASPEKPKASRKRKNNAECYK